MALYAVLHSRPREERPSTPVTHSASSEASPSTGDTASTAPHRTWRNVIGYFNALSGDIESRSCQEGLPTYDMVCSEPNAGADAASQDILPAYSCSVSAEDKLSMRYEYRDPFIPADSSSWQDVYVVLQGTQLSLHQVKSPGLFAKARSTGGRAGRLIRRFTLQHAEVGLASDIKKVEWVPRSNLTRALSAAALDGLLQTEPHLFKAVRQYPLRLRVETEQFLLKFPTHDYREEWLHKICSAIDIAPPLDDRTEPKIHTLPRRSRNRHATPSRVGASVELRSGPFLEEQERLLRQYYPRLGEQPAEGLEGYAAAPAAHEVEIEGLEVTINSSDPEQEEIDPGFSLTLNATLSGLLSGSQLNVTSPRSQPSVHDLWASVHRLHPLTVVSTLPGKWSSGLLIDPIQERVYRRRCLPVLLKNSRRAVPFVIKNSIRYQIDFDAKELKQYPTPPPPYSKYLNPSNLDFARHLAVMTKSADPSHVDVEGRSDDMFSAHLSYPSSTSSEDLLSSSGTSNSSWAERLRRKHKQHIENVPFSSVQDYTLSYIKSRWTDGSDLRRSLQPNRGAIAR